MNTLISVLLVCMAIFTSQQTGIVNPTSKCSTVHELFLLKPPILTALMHRISTTYYIVLRDFMWDSRWRSGLGVGISSSLLLIIISLLLLCQLPLEHAVLLTRQHIIITLLSKLGVSFSTQILANCRIRKCFCYYYFAIYPRILTSYPRLHKNQKLITCN